MWTDEQEIYILRSEVGIQEVRGQFEKERRRPRPGSGDPAAQHSRIRSCRTGRHWSRSRRHHNQSRLYSMYAGNDSY